MKKPEFSHALAACLARFRAAQEGNTCLFDENVSGPCSTSLRIRRMGHRDALTQCALDESTLQGEKQSGCSLYVIPDAS